MDLLSGDSLHHLFSFLPETCLLGLAATCKKYRRLVFSLPLFTHITINTDRNSQNDPQRLQSVIFLFPNAEIFNATGNTTQTWVDIENDTPVNLKFQTIIIDCPIDHQFLKVLQYCPELTELHINHQTSESNISAFIPYIANLSNLQNLHLPRSTVIDSPQLISQLLTSCSLTLLDFRYSTRKDPHFWKTVATGTPPEKIKILKTLELVSYGTVAVEDSDSDISEIIHYFPELFRLSFKGSLEYDCLNSFLTENTEIRDLVLPWPQKDYTEKMEKFISEYPKKLYGIQIQSRNDRLLQLLHDHHGPGLTSLSLACTEGVTTEGLVTLLSKCPNLEFLFLYFFDGHSWDHTLGDTIRDIPELKGLWLGSLSTTVMVENVHVEHPKVRKIDLHELRVNFLEITCPNAKEIIPPISITDGQNAHEIYQKCYPNSFVVRVAEGYMVAIVKVRPTDTVEDLKRKIMEELGKEVVMSVIVGGKALKGSQICGDCLRNGSLVKLLS